MEGEKLEQETFKFHGCPFVTKADTAGLVKEILVLFEAILGLLERELLSGEVHGKKGGTWIVDCFTAGRIEQFETMFQVFLNEGSGGLVGSGGYADREAVQKDLHRTQSILARLKVFFALHPEYRPTDQQG
ncbi:MAG: hypothetical protein WCT28_03215 [Patescibacteria group bacterium]|jgi:hypothetical protein